MSNKKHRSLLHHETPRKKILVIEYITLHPVEIGILRPGHNDFSAFQRKDKLL